jgi:thiol-disulfide isomerase/thioredoxin
MSVRRALRVALPLLAALALGACGSGGSGSAPKGDTRPLPPSASGLPAALAANARQANQIVGEGAGDFQKRLGRLRGHPVVVNQWASWCPNCRAEFPFFRSAIARYRDRVAFLGLDSQDNRGDAESFLEQIPSDFPSILDQDASVAAALGGGQSWPTTFFLDKNGQVAQVHIGAYPTEELLTRDIQRYALGRS